MMVVKSLTIRSDQQEWIDESDLNFSKFIRRLIDDEMKRDARSDHDR